MRKPPCVRPTTQLSYLLIYLYTYSSVTLDPLLRPSLDRRFFDAVMLEVPGIQLVKLLVSCCASADDVSKVT
jgi:hypothetical protein